MIRIGLNARLFPANWRPMVDEITFAANNGFQSMQVIGREAGITPELLGADVESVGEALRQANIMPVMEINLEMQPNGLTAGGAQPMDVLRANLPAITALGITAVHWHCTLQDRALPDAEVRALEKLLTPQMQQGVELAAQHGFRFGFEHNAPDLRLFAHPNQCADMLDTVTDLHFVWDFNHTHLDHAAGFKALAGRFSLLHVSDAPLPETNYHLPLGMGSVPFADYLATAVQAGYTGAAILEIGGLPKSGGFGRDTDAALNDSRQRLEAALRPLS
jgi:L-ribulose-5-phosphate 3-epimerase